MFNENTCRLCLKQGNNHDSLFENNFLEMLDSLTSIKVTKNDKFSTLICLSCVSNLKVAYGIQQYIIRTDKKLHEHFILTEVIKGECSNVRKQPELVDSIRLENCDTSRNVEVKEKNEIFSCIVCPRKFNCEMNYLKHLKLHDTRRCPICRENISNKKYEKHMLGHPQIVCEHCGELSRNLESHQVHVRKMHTGEATHICDVCGEKSYDSKHFKHHMKNAHQNWKPFMCEICSKSFANQTNLWIHQKSHKPEHNPNKVSCKFCTKEFKYYKQLTKHLQSAHKVIETMKFHCVYCGKRFATETAVKIHSSRHKK